MTPGGTYMSKNQRTPWSWPCHRPGDPQTSSEFPVSQTALSHPSREAQSSSPLPRFWLLSRRLAGCRPTLMNQLHSKERLNGWKPKLSVTVRLTWRWTAVCPRGKDPKPPQKRFLLDEGGALEVAVTGLFECEKQTMFMVLDMCSKFSDKISFFPFYLSTFFWFLILLLVTLFASCYILNILRLFGPQAERWYFYFSE